MRHLLLTSVAILCGAGTAQAVTVNFNSLEENALIDSPLSLGGLVFSNPGNGSGQHAFSTSGSTGSTTLLPNYYGSTTTVTTVDGSPFTLQALDFADGFNFGDDPLSLTLTFTTANGSISESRIADLLPGLQTEVFNQSGILSFTLTASNSLYEENTFLLDNVRYSAETAPSAVPEPASWSLLLAGFGMIGFSSRQRRRSHLA